MGLQPESYRSQLSYSEAFRRGNLLTAEVPLIPVFFYLSNVCFFSFFFSCSPSVVTALPSYRKRGVWVYFVCVLPLSKALCIVLQGDVEKGLEMKKLVLSGFLASEEIYINQLEALLLVRNWVGHAHTLTQLLRSDLRRAPPAELADHFWLDHCDCSFLKLVSSRRSAICHFLPFFVATCLPCDHYVVLHMSATW